MKDLKIDFENKRIINEYVDNKDRVIQQIKVAVRIWKKDWMLDDDFGVDYDIAWGNTLTMGSHIKKMIAQVPGVMSIESFAIKKDTSNENNIQFIIDAKIRFMNEVIIISERV